MTLRKRDAVPRARRVSAVGMLLLAAAGLCAARPAAAQQSANEQAVWKLETAYWNAVKSVDLVGYRALWHEDFVGWPYSSAQPVRKDHITDWITEPTGKGLHLQWYSIEPAASQATDNVVITHYWVTGFWTDKAGHGDEPETSRITHTWLKTAGGWQIVGGMSVSPSRGK